MCSLKMKAWIHTNILHITFVCVSVCMCALKVRGQFEGISSFLLPRECLGCGVWRQELPSARDPCPETPALLFTAVLSMLGPREKQIRLMDIHNVVPSLPCLCDRNMTKSNLRRKEFISVYLQSIMKGKSGVVAHTFNPHTLEVEAGGSLGSRTARTEKELK